MTYREIGFILLLAVVVFWAVSIAKDILDPQRNYRQDKEYCRFDYDCQVVYDVLSNNCLAVNLLHKHEFDQDVTCHKRLSICSNHRCVSP